MVRVIDRPMRHSDENWGSVRRRTDRLPGTPGGKCGGSLRLQGPTDEKSKPRTDAIRNRERVLEAAKAVFSEGGPEASLEAVARHAAVEIGTLYRHFPTREALYEAVYRREVDQLVELASQLRGAGEAGRGIAQMDAGWRRIHGDEEGHGDSARFSGTQFV